jgi:tetrapyrrole methylase family protein/MazG family protein
LAAEISDSPPIGPLLAEIEGRLGLRVADGLQLLGPDGLVVQPFDPGWPLLVLAAGATTGTAAARSNATDPAFSPAVLPGRNARPPEALAILRALYPPDHPVLGLAGAADTTLSSISDAELRSRPHLLPALAGETNLASPYGLPWIAARLRAPDGCPWDRAQTHQTLRKHLLEEAYEVYDALEAGASPALADELGDLLLQVVLHAQHAAEAGVFDLSDVYRAIDAKLVRRHPHVFGEVEANSVDQVVRNWEAIKAVERADGPAAPVEAGMPAAFAGLSRSLPALAYSQEMQERAASLGYDWPDVEGVIDKLEEEAIELVEAEGPAARAEELGDLLLVIVNLGRKLEIDAEAALRAASRKFAARFAIVERLASGAGRELRTMTFEELDDLWQAAKREERLAPGRPELGREVRP